MLIMRTNPLVPVCFVLGSLIIGMKNKPLSNDAISASVLPGMWKERHASTRDMVKKMLVPSIFHLLNITAVGCLI